MNLLLLKQISILSAFAGIIFGLLTLIPYLSLFTFILLTTVLSVFIIIYLKKNSLIGILNIKEGCIFGSAIGFISFIAFVAVYMPLSMLLSVLISTYPQRHFNYFITDFGTFVVTIFIVLFIALISALFNGFSGLITAYAYQLITGIKKEDDENNSVDFTIE